MAFHFSANQYQSAFDSNHLQSWNIAKRYKEHPSTHDGHTEFITNDRGHLLPGIPKSERNPWGMFVGTWDMPLKIPPFKASLTGRSAQAAKHLTEWMLKPTSLTDASNGLQPQITGKATEELHSSKHSAKVARRNSRCPSNSSEKLNRSPESQPRQNSRCSSHASEKLSHLPEPQPNEEGKADEGKEAAPSDSTPPHSGCGTPKEEAESKCSTPSIKAGSRSSSCQEKKPDKPLEETLCDIDS
ncbi:protein Flattop [Microcaecilia unicolor]|uniref:Protein Flattop n=1 Tax=Microcaecilia unicolor TaxID=1415580 RepID=A0A6P7WJR2_9AMPH|nr:protein Flattop [Microcaecilia unicolor]